MKKHKILITIFTILILIGVLLALPFTRSFVVMSIYSASEQQKSVLKQADIKISLPGGLSTVKKDWYPFVITFNASNFGTYVNKDVDLTILYNFGAFDYSKASSTFYNDQSDYHGAFYGAYAVKTNQATPYGYNTDGSIAVSEMASIFKYDMNELVLKSIGCKDPAFNFTITGTQQITMHGQNYTVVDAEIITNSPLHTVKQNHMAYIQYGKPNRMLTEKDFKKTLSYGRIYASTIKDKNITLCFYIIAPNLAVLDQTEEAFIKKAELKLN